MRLRSSSIAFSLLPLLFLSPLLSLACGGKLDEAATTPSPGPSPDSGGAVSDDGGAPSPEASVAGAAVLATEGCYFSAAAMDATYLYFACENGPVTRLPKDGSAPPSPLTPSFPNVMGIAVDDDDDDVYFTILETDAQDSSGEVARVPKVGGAVESLATGQLRPWGVTLDATHVYWANQGTDATGAPGNDGSIMAIDKQGGPATVLSAGEQMPMKIATSGATLVWIDTPWGSDNASVRALPIGVEGAQPASIASGLGYTTGPVAGPDSEIFWVNISDGDPDSEGSIVEVSLSGDSPQQLTVAPWGPPSIAIANGTLFYGDVGQEPGAIWSMPAFGGTPAEIAPPPALPTDLSVGETPLFLLADAQHVFVFDYYATQSSGEAGLIRAVAR